MFFSPIAMAAGALTWTLTEYCMHRWMGHASRKKMADDRPKRAINLSLLTGDFGVEHRTHHATPSQFASKRQKAAAAVAVVSVMGTAASVLVGPRRGISFAAGFTAMYVGYELVHWGIHSVPPSTAYGRWARRHHLYHHHGNSKLNQGVSTPLWDKVMGTEVVPETIKIPRRVAPVWMVDPETMEVYKEYEQDYQLVPLAKPKVSKTYEPVVEMQTAAAE
jgi:hypothetical protein